MGEAAFQALVSTSFAPPPNPTLVAAQNVAQNVAQKALGAAFGAAQKWTADPDNARIISGLTTIGIATVNSFPSGSVLMRQGMSE